MEERCFWFHVNGEEEKAAPTKFFLIFLALFSIHFSNLFSFFPFPVCVWLFIWRGGVKISYEGDGRRDLLEIQGREYLFVFYKDASENEIVPKNIVMDLM